jgi:YHS domain-containing protein
VPRREEERRTSVPASHDVLVEDPVCHTYIPKGQAIVYKSRDEIHYFCSEKCRQTFVSEKGDTR